MSNSPSTDVSILVVEDDAAVAEIMSTALTHRGYQVAVATGAQQALVSARADPPDVILLDLGLPDGDGVDVCRDLRKWYRNPIIVVTAEQDETRKIEALDLGADDYVTKPFSMPELLARLRVALRHSSQLDEAGADESGTNGAAATSDELVLGDLEIDIDAHIVTVAGTPTLLTRKEFGLLELFARNPGRMMSHAKILAQVWGPDAGTTESLRVHVTNLRKKLGTGPHRPVLRTESGVGYRLEAPPEEQHE